MIPAVMEDNAWMEDAVATIIGLVHNQEIVTAEDVAREMRRPPVSNWIGLAFTKAKNEGHIEWVRYVRSNTKSRKGGSVSEWTRRRINKGVAA
jgi:alkylated DNA nucleotide flippase Atl1